MKDTEKIPPPRENVITALIYIPRVSRLEDIDKGLQLMSERVADGRPTFGSPSGGCGGGTSHSWHSRTEQVLKLIIQKNMWHFKQL